MITLAKVDVQHEKAKKHRVEKCIDGTYRVYSSSKSVYIVALSGKNVRRCTCRNGIERARPTCTHLLAVAIFIAERKGYLVQPIPAYFIEENIDDITGSGCSFFSVSPNIALLARKRDGQEPEFQIGEIKTDFLAQYDKLLQ